MKPRFFCILNLTFSCLIFIDLSSITAQKEVIHFEHIGLEHGLPQGQILGLLQDSHGYIWFGTMTGLVRYDGYNFIRYFHVSTDSSSLSQSSAAPRAEDRMGNIWVGSHTGLNRWDRKINRFQRFYHDSDDPNSLPDNSIHDVFEDSEGRLWIGTFRGLAWYDGKLFHQISLTKPVASPTWVQVFSILEDEKGLMLAGTNYGLAKIDRQQQTGIIFPVDCDSTCNPLPEVWKVYKDRKGRVWVGTDIGLFLWNGEESSFNRILLKGTPQQQAVRNIIQDKWGFLWISTLNNNGLFQYNPSTGDLEHFQYSPSNSFGLSSNHVRSFMIDRLNNLWIGTYNGLNKVDLNPPRFAFLQQELGDKRPENLVFRAHSDNEGGLWFSTYQHRIYYAKEPKVKAVEMDFLPFKVYPSEVSGFCSSSDGVVWIAAWPNCLIRYHIETGQSEALNELTDSGDDTEIQGYYYMEEDNNNSDYMWFSSKSGLCKVHKKTLERTYFPPQRDIPVLKENRIWNGLQTPDNYIYVLFESHFNGKLGRFDKQTKSYELIETARAFPDGKNTIHIRQFAYTPDGTLWMATAVGLGKLLPDGGAFTLITTRDGMIEDNLMGIATDTQGNVWLKSMQHLSKYNPRLDSFWHFNVTRDMKEFNSVGATVGKDGQIFFYGNNGFYAFYPDSIKLDSTLPKVVLTDFKVLNLSRHFGTSSELIKDITLNYRDNVFSFEYAAMHFRNPKNNRYQYRLEGFDENWVEAGTERKVTYTNLDPGQYTFRVMACNTDGVWNSETLTIGLRLLPPPWLTWWAYTLYSLLFAFIGWSVYAFLKRRWQLKAELALEHREAERLKELDAVKTKLYTNITHEFRTPLTVILGMAEQIKNNPKEWFNEGLKMIKRNGNNLLHLVNQMLDLSKLEAGMLPVHKIQGDVITFLKYVLESFHSLAESKNIELQFQSDLEELMMDYDPNKLLNIASNLLSNAIKFTDEGGDVYVKASWVSAPSDNPTLTISIKDTGIGIPKTALPFIFDRFYQTDDSTILQGSGTGIGLALTKELVKLFLYGQ